MGNGLRPGDVGASVHLEFSSWLKLGVAAHAWPGCDPGILGSGGREGQGQTTSATKCVLVQSKLYKTLSQGTR